MESLDCLRPRGLMVNYGDASSAVIALNLGVSDRSLLFMARLTSSATLPAASCLPKRTTFSTWCARVLWEFEISQRFP